MSQFLTFVDKPSDQGRDFIGTLIDSSLKAEALVVARVGLDEQMMIHFVGKVQDESKS
jgi:hypothetical protein